MAEDVAIALSNVSKCFKRYEKPSDRLKEMLLPGKSRAQEFWALRDINLEVRRGETLGVIGQNGSGKSTLLQIIAGTLTPTAGEVRVNGRVSALLELGSGFNPEFTGRQNVFFNGRILGLNQEEIETKFDEIAGFADIGDFIDQPVKTYSSGMFVRLAFAAAVHVEPEIFIVDEALAVGDVIFQHRCMRRIKMLMDSGVTTLFVSHDPGAVKTLCGSACMLNQGTMYTYGKPDDVFIEYMKLVTRIELEQEKTNSEHHQEKSLVEGQFLLEASQVMTEATSTEELPIQANSSRRGSGRAKITRIQMVHETGDLAASTPTFKFNEEIQLWVYVESNESLEDFIVGFFVSDKNGNEVLGSNTREEKIVLGNLNIGDCLEFKFKFRLPLRPGSYSVTVAGAENYLTPTCDWIDKCTVIEILPPRDGKIITAFVDIPINVEANKIA